MTDRVAIAAIKRSESGQLASDQDLVSVEAPLMVEMRQPHRSDIRSLGVLMRTPGDDRDLVLGLLYTEGVIRAASDVLSFEARSVATDEEARAELVTVTLAAAIDLAAIATERALPSTSACGLCGRLAIQGVSAIAGRALPTHLPRISAALIAELPTRLRADQAVFAETGGLHAAGLFQPTGRRLAVREDVGRHNAVDKLVGAGLAAGWLPAREAVLVVSGRVAFEIVQKAVMAGVAVLVAVGAPSSLAVEAARAAGVTLIGFARDERFNIYSGADRVVA